MRNIQAVVSAIAITAAISMSACGGTETEPTTAPLTPVPSPPAPAEHQVEATPAHSGGPARLIGQPETNGTSNGTVNPACATGVPAASYHGAEADWIVGRLASGSDGIQYWFDRAHADTACACAGCAAGGCIVQQSVPEHAVCVGLQPPS